MVKLVEETLNVDERGRVVIPSHIRKAVGIRGRGKLLVKRDGSKIILEPYPGDLNKNVEEWANLARSVRAEIFSETLEEGCKWICRDYAKRKLGLP